MEIYKEYLEFAKNIAKHAGEIMLKYFNKKGISQYKGDRTIVTLADTEINSYLIEQVKKHYPTHAVDGEEETYGSGNHSWTCDPVDGTAMFARGVPIAVFSLALVIDGISVVGVVYDPFLKEMYTAIKGQGAFKNGEPINTNDYDLDDARCMGGFSTWPGAKWNIYPAVSKIPAYTTYIGTTTRSSMMVAEGHFSFEIFACHGTKGNKDMAAAKVIVEEAGGTVRSFNGDNERMDGALNGVIVCNQTTYPKIFEIIKKYIKPQNRG